MEKKKSKLKAGLKSKLEEMKEKIEKPKGRRSHAGGLSARLDHLIQFQDYDEEREAARRRHLRRAALLGAGAGATVQGGASHLLLRKSVGLGLRESLPITAIAGAKGAVLGSALGLGAGLVTRPKRRKIEELSAKLDDLIEFQPKPYSREILESAWRRVNKPSRVTLGAMLRRHGEHRNPPTMLFRMKKNWLKGLKKVALLAKLDDLIYFQDPRPRNPLGEFTGQPQGPDPNAMEQTYRSGLRRGVLEGVGTASAGAAAGALSGLAAKELATKIRLFRRTKGASKIITP
jgi:hypothetical protein